MAPSAPHRILVVDDERLLHNVLTRLLSRHGMEVTSSMSAPEALELLKEQKFDLVLTDFQMPEMDGLELLARIREQYPTLPVVMITGLSSVQGAVQAMHGGAVDYLPKPFSTDELVERLKKHLDAPPPAPAAPAKQKKGGSPTSSQGVAFVGEHPSIQQLKSLVPRFAGSKAPVFVHGESGTGKEVLARLVHQQSNRATGPFVALNCANLPTELVESHLFGHKKGAFTGAVEDMAGAFARADGGTLLLDEVTEVAPNVQAKLLRVLQEGEFQRVGSEKTEKVDVRIVATSNRDLQQAIRDGAFREDLYHRLAVFPLYVPPLRERASDVRVLADAFVDRYCATYGFEKKQLAEDLVRRLEGYPWPGNVRELGNMIHRGVVLAGDRPVVTTGDVMNEFFVDGLRLGSPYEAPPAAMASTNGAPAPAAPAYTSPAAAPAPVAPSAIAYPSAVAYTPAPASGDTFEALDGLTLAEVERRLIFRALEKNDNNQERAADDLGICARTIRNKLKKYREEEMVA